MSRRNVNKIIVVGNLGHDPELRYTAKGNPVTSFSLATGRGAKIAEESNEEATYWHRANVWGKRAETCAKYLKKGASVYVEGDLMMKNWVDKEGKARQTSEIMVQDIRFLTMGGRSAVPAVAMEDSPAPALAQ